MLCPLSNSGWILVCRRWGIVAADVGLSCWSALNVRCGRRRLLSLLVGGCLCRWWRFLAEEVSCSGDRRQGLSLHLLRVDVQVAETDGRVCEEWHGNLRAVKGDGVRESVPI